MGKKLLITADIHLSPRPDHEYRWKVMESLGNRAEQDDDVAAIVIAGDLVDAKDHHSAVFVNRVVDSVATMAAAGKRIFIMKGNHDYVDADCPFFRFLEEIAEVVYISHPINFPVVGQEVLLIPHVKSWNPRAGWRVSYPLDDGYNVIICHQTFGGAEASNGHSLPGVPLATVSAKRTGGTRVLAGDIHVPQTIGNVTYVGSPHPVAFGDTFRPGIVEWDLDEQKLKRIKRTTIRRLVLEYDLQGSCLERRDSDYVPAPREGDHVKMRCHGTRAEAAHWSEIRRAYLREADQFGYTVFSTEFVVTDTARPKRWPRRESFNEEYDRKSVTDNEEFEAYCEESAVPKEYLETGRSMI